MAAEKPEKPKPEEPKTTEKPVKAQPEKLGRNSSCPCGSGKKYKYCCGRGRS